jgi:hypothetical protein
MLEPGRLLPRPDLPTAAALPTATMRESYRASAVRLAAWTLAAFVVACGSDDLPDPIHYACPGGCISAEFATFDLNCSHNDLVSVTASGPCSMPDASLTWYTGAATEYTVSVGSTSPGICHVDLAFATGFTYSADVTFTSQTLSSAPGCPECHFIGPTGGPFVVGNPSDTCVDAAIGELPDASADANSDE